MNIDSWPAGFRQKGYLYKRFFSAVPVEVF